MEIYRKRSNSGTIYRIMDDGNRTMDIHIYSIEYAKTFNNEGEIIYGWYPLYEPKNKLFTNWDEVKTLFDKVISED